MGVESGRPGKVNGVDDQHGTNAAASKPSAQIADDEAEQAEGTRGQQEEREHPGRMGDAQRHEQARRGEMIRAQRMTTWSRRADMLTRHDLEIRKTLRRQIS